MNAPERHRGLVIGVPIDAVSWDEATDRILYWARARQSKYVSVCNVHVVVTAVRDSEYFEIIETADLAVPDGAPVAWRLRQMGFASQKRLAGPDLMLRLTELAAGRGVPVYFYGSTKDVLGMMVTSLKRAYPRLVVAGVESPPFRPLTEGEDEAAVERINSSGAGIVFVGLGCPKQERWMSAHRGRINAVMLGVGAAFDFHAGVAPRAPRIMQKYGFEWLHRLAHSPRRLGWRYLTTNSYFVLEIARETFIGRWSRLRERAKKGF